jgi:Flp pilus assembly pilin Flp
MRRVGDHLFCFFVVFGRSQVPSLRNVLACLRQDCSGSSLLEYSLLVTIIVIVFVGVALVGRWAAGVWTNLVPALPP